AAREGLARLDGGGQEGRVAVVAAPEDVPSVAAAISAELGEHLAREGASPLDARLAVMEPRRTKGLEFDVVVLVEPLAVGARSTGDLYVAMTRPTRALLVVASRGLPAGFPPAHADPA